MMRYAGSLFGAGMLAGVLDRGAGSAPGLDTFRLVLAVVTVTAAFGVVAAALSHRFSADPGSD